MARILLIVAGLFEVVWAYSMKLSNPMRLCAALLIVSGLVLMKLSAH